LPGATIAGRVPSPLVMMCQELEGVFSPRFDQGRQAYSVSEGSGWHPRYCENVGWSQRMRQKREEALVDGKSRMGYSANHMPRVPPLAHPQFCPNAPRGLLHFTYTLGLTNAFHARSSRGHDGSDKTNGRPADICLHVTSELNGNATIRSSTTLILLNYQALNVQSGVQWIQAASTLTLFNSYTPQADHC